MHLPELLHGLGRPQLVMDLMSWTSRKKVPGEQRNSVFQEGLKNIYPFPFIEHFAISNVLLCALFHFHNTRLHQITLVETWKSEWQWGKCYAEICRMSQAELEQEIAFLNLLSFWALCPGCGNIPLQATLSSPHGSISRNFVFVLSSPFSSPSWGFVLLLWNLQLIFYQISAGSYPFSFSIEESLGVE